MEQHQIESSVLPDSSEQTNRGGCERYSPHKIDDRSGMVSFITSFKIYIYIYKAQSAWHKKIQNTGQPNILEMHINTNKYKHFISESSII